VRIPGEAGAVVGDCFDFAHDGNIAILEHLHILAKLGKPVGTMAQEFTFHQVRRHDPTVKRAKTLRLQRSFDEVARSRD
jgi:hypothetical protein